MAFDFTYDVFLLYLAFEAAERAFQRLVIAEFHFCQCVFTCLSIVAILDFPSTSAACDDALVIFAAVKGSAQDTCWPQYRQAAAKPRFEVFPIKGKVAAFSHITNQIGFTQ